MSRDQVVNYTCDRCDFSVKSDGAPPAGWLAALIVEGGAPFDLCGPCRVAIGRPVASGGLDVSGAERDAARARGPAVTDPRGRLS